MLVSDFQAGDDTTTIKKAVAAWSAAGGSLVFDRTEYNLEDTVNLGGLRQVGGMITCAGGPASELFRVDRDANRPGRQTSVRHLGSRIIWRGSADRPMFTYDGMQLTWDGPALWGNVQGTDQRAKTGFEITKDAGLGTGSVHFRQLHVAGCETALHANGVANVDQFQVDRFKVQDCGLGFRSESAQNVGNLFGFVTAHSVDTLFSFAHLTQTTIQNLIVNNAVKTVIRADKSGRESGHIAVMAGKVDRHSSGSLLVDTNWLSFGRFAFYNFVGWRCNLRLMGEAVVSFIGCQGIGDSGSVDATRISATRRPRIVFDACRVSETLQHPQAEFIYRDCFSASGSPMPEPIENVATVGRIPSTE